MPPIDLDRFQLAPAGSIAAARAEIAAGHKRTHWMWFVFPQVVGLGTSAMSRQYAINTIDEASAYLAHPVLGTEYRRLVDLVWHQVIERGVRIATLCGSPDDAKLVSSLTLFAGVGRRLEVAETELGTFVQRADDILAAGAAEGLDRCPTTVEFLETSAHGGETGPRSRDESVRRG